MGIQVLSKETIDKIAAGEVVERPLNVVKELVENSMDAGAAAITVEISDGGTKLIRVTDDGKGIPAAEVEKAFLRHATSKIESADDLMQIKSLGFRGEALSSISAVSRLSMVTKTYEGLLAAECIYEGGKFIAVNDIGAPKGTTVIVRDLFYNVPARRKFLKSNNTEAGAVTELMEELALSRPDIAFKYIINKKQRFSTSGKGNLKDIIYRLYGKDISDNILFIEKNEDFAWGNITGYIGTPYTDKGTRAFESFFINGRYLKNEHLSKGIEDAYKPYLMQHRFPFCVLHITMDPALLDVNVHPAKMQVRFADPDSVREIVYNACKDALNSHEMLRTVKFTDNKEKAAEAKEIQLINKSPSPEPFEYERRSTGAEFDYDSVIDKTRVNESLNDFHGEKLITTAPENKLSDSLLDGEWDIDFTDENAGIVEDGPIEANETVVLDNVSAFQNANNIPETFPVIKDEQQLDMFTERMIDPALRDRYRLIGQVFETYYLIEYNKELLIMDQHAAHEKVHYERILKQLKGSGTFSTPIMPPELIDLPGKLSSLYEEYSDYFQKLGFEVEDFGDASFAIRAVPLELYGRSAKELFMDIMDELTTGAIGDEPDVILAKIASMACKAAVKGNSSLSLPEAEALLDELLKLDNPYHCPHGRPTIIKMSKQELEKRFKRIV